MLVSIIIACIVAGGCGDDEPAGVIVILVGILPFTIGNIAMLVLCIMLNYRFWNIIQDGYACTTPGKAIGFFFIPIFNIYWLWVLLVGTAQNLNQYCNRHQIPLYKPANEELGIATYIVFLIPYVNLLSPFLAVPLLYSNARVADTILEYQQRI
ncbi:MAG: hypothetical protein Q4C70_07050 [Planctomycetia bacterium]|nr:hypothetical protein [Planctomycetia bacterium]